MNLTIAIIIGSMVFITLYVGLLIVADKRGW